MNDQVFNTDPEAIPAEEYWADFEQYSAEHPMTGPTPDEYREVRADGNDR